MSVLPPLAMVVGALAALLLTPAETPILGLNHADFAKAELGVALITFFLIAGIRRAGAGGVVRVIGGALTWMLLTLALTGVYAYRFELADVADRVMAELSPNEAQIGRGGEVIIKRRLGGEFVIPAKINDVPISCLFYTGASSVVLRAQDAAKVGIDASKLDFDVGVVTANGSAMAAQVRVDKIAVGGIVARNVRALVAKPGALSESLLGMSFLERLDSYSVERGKLVLKAK